MRVNPLAMVVSKNRLEGSLSDTSLSDLLDACHKHLVTGAIKIVDEKNKRNGVLVLRAGAVDQARFGDTVGDKAVQTMLELKDGMYELSQQLPDLSGDLGRAAALEGSVEQVSIVQIMRHCEHNALSAVITVMNEYDRGEIHYRAGELEKVMLNGKADDDAIVTMLAWPKARYKVVAPPLAADIGGWPKMGREDTQPFKVAEAVRPPAAEAPTVQAKPKRGSEPPPTAEPSYPLIEIEEAGPAEPLVAEPLARAVSAEPIAKPARRRSMSTMLLQALLLTIAATLVLTFVVLLASR
jgi:hypothetical protein